MLLIVTPSGPSSTASVRVSMRTPPLLAQYAAKFGNAISSCTELMLITLPGRRAAMRCRTNAWVAKNTPLRFDVDHRVEVALRHVPERGVRLDAGVVDEHVETAERLGAFGDQPLHVGDVAEVGLDAGAAPAERPDLPRAPPRRPLRVAVVVDDDIGAFLRQSNGDGCGRCPCCCRSRGPCGRAGARWRAPLRSHGHRVHLVTRQLVRAAIVRAFMSHLSGGRASG